MGEIVLIRHGQANSKATNEADYDRLSPLGRQQAEWLGAHLRAQEGPFDAVLQGTLNRHRQTSASMGHLGRAPVADDRLNEMDYFNLGRALEDHDGTPMPEPDGFAIHLPKVMDVWHCAMIQGNESFSAFESRVTSVFQEAVQPGRRVLCVTSGGVIGMAIRHLLGLNTTQLAQILLPIYNTSIHRFHVTPNGLFFAGYNGTPHLDPPDRIHARTHY